MKFEEWVKGIENAAIKGLCSTHPNICKMIYNEGQKDIEKALKDKGVCLQSEYDELKEKVEGYERVRNRLIEIGFPTFMSCKEYAEQIADLERKLEQTEKDLTDYQFNYPKIKDLEKQIKKMRCCGNCKGVCTSDDVAHFCKDNDYKLWEIKEND